MEENMPQQPQIPTPPIVPIPPSAQARTIVPMACPQCHQPVPVGAYFCPNCGKKLDDREPPLSTSVLSQFLLYAFSIVLPMIAYLAITRWQGIKYVRSDDPKAQQMGWIAIGLLTISSVIMIWLTAQAVNGFVKSATSTAGLSLYGL